MPALKQIVPAEQAGSGLRVSGSAFCASAGAAAPRCHFFCGYLEALLSQSGEGKPVAVRETQCRAAGHDACVFEVDA